MEKRNIFGIKRDNNKILVLLFAILACVVLSLYVGFIRGEEIVYTHFFYIPILLAGVWYRKKAIYAALFLSIVYILVTHFSHQVVSIDNVERCAIFIAVAYVIGLVSEKRAKGEDALRASEKKLRETMDYLDNIIKSSADAIVVVDMEGIVRSWNKAAESIMGYTADEAVGTSNKRFFANAKEADRIMEIMQREEELKNYRTIVSRKNGNPVHISVSAALLKDKDGMPIGTVRVSRDITKEVELEEEIKRERDRLYSMFETVADGVYIVSKDYKVEFMNKVLKDEFGDHLGDICYKVFHNREEPCPKCKHPEVLEGETIRWEWFSHRVNKTYDLIETPLRNIDGTSSKLTIFRDITERKRVEQSLQRLSKELELKVKERTKELVEERDYTRHLIESSPDFQLTLDKDGKIMDMNEAFEHLVGKGREDMIGKSYIHEYIPLEETKRLISEIFDKGWVRNVELMVNMPGKGTLTWNLSGTVFTTIKGEEGVYLTGRDLTELRTKEAQIIQAGRLSSLGEMATGVAHEINQPLSVISMAAESTLRDLEKNRLDINMVPKDLKEILKNVRRIDRIITHMRTFARQPEEWKSVEPEELLNTVFILLDAQFRGHNISVSRKVKENLPAIYVDPNQVEQVFINILTNARQVLDERGEEAEREGGGEEFEKKLVCGISRERIEEKDYVVFEFADNAYGVPDEQKARIFEPFFTTKEAGEGTGLGLSIAYNIVTHSLGGKIWVDDNEAGGASFKVALPVKNENKTTETRRRGGL
ncbi:MAG: PAS domain S-box protein [Halobacteriota archaeon]